MRYVLAPLAGFTDAPFRRLCFEGGADLCYSEMISAAGLAHGSSPTRHLMMTMPGEGPVALQIFGSRESDVAFAAREIDAFVKHSVSSPVIELNLNAGCPMTKVTREGAGAKLIEDPGQIARLVQAMVRETTLPVTVKTRLGSRPDKTVIFEIADAAEKAGAKGLSVHARYTSQMHGGLVHLDVLSEVVSRTKLPVTGNGSVTDAATAAAMAQTGVQSIMIGRASLAHPGIFAKLKGCETALDSDLSFQRHLAYLLQFRNQLVQAFPRDHIPSVDGYASVKLHTHLFRYFSGRPGAAALRARLNGIRTLREILEIGRVLGGVASC